MTQDQPTQVGRKLASRPPRPTEQLVPGQQIAERFTVSRLLGSGGMGAVYEAEDLVTQRPVAVKILSAALSRQPTLVERFAREARFTAALHHPNIVKVTATGEHQGRPLLVMNYLDGETLEARVARTGPLALAEVLPVAEQACAGLAYVHARGWVHRDVKSANVMVSSTGHVTLLDFGITRDPREAALTQEGFTVGTVGYMAPEQAIGGPDLDGRADQYALACVLFELLSGRLPVEEANDAKRLARQLQHAPSDVRQFAPEVPAAVARVLARALAGSPRRRFRTIGAFGKALAKAALPRVSWLDAHLPSLQPAWARAATAAAMVAALALLGGATMHRVRPSRGPADPRTQAVKFPTRLG